MRIVHAIALEYSVKYVLFYFHCCGAAAKPPHHSNHASFLKKKLEGALFTEY